MELSYVSTLNSLCKELGAGIQYSISYGDSNLVNIENHRNNIPRFGTTLKEEIRVHIQALLRNSEPFKSMKLITLGNRGIGKTTLVDTFSRILDPNFQVYSLTVVIVAI